ncbi:hypothetical protein [Sulfurospirillum diekertiae]|uniref:Uncharacterized protein n=1 Tax=Sulfurospirillum diekertiae TaxID=1854492 RepID=A0A1Y0HIH1_9BACT|nr:hypothetical protein [Sulfurospirillum diekertiae]ARU47224.1 hypothetical protein Sdiek1_0036 [Sulfurospirillum diekertiae]ASC92078.1 hypothetical protein Sdiek2_0035 [Sulfurospirillum diekertiae]
MQVSSTLQNNIVSPTNYEPLNHNVGTSQQALSSTLAIAPNIKAWDYVDLGEDISAYTTISPKQEQTNQELINYLSTLMNDKTDEGRQNLKAYDLNQHNSLKSSLKIFKDFGEKVVAGKVEQLQSLPILPLTTYQIEHPYYVHGTNGEEIKNMSFDELYDFLGKDYFGKNTSKSQFKVYAERIGIFTVAFDERQKQFDYTLTGRSIKSLEQGIKDKDPNLTVHYLYELHETTPEAMDAMKMERFKNLYSFTDEFAKTDKFQQLYDTFLENREKNQEIETATKQRKNLVDVVGSERFFTSEVAGRDLSRAQVIEHYTTITEDLKALKIPPENTTYNDTVTKNLDDSIKLYEKITSDLKQMWHYGDVDMQG